MAHSRTPILLVRGRISALKPEKNYGFIALSGTGEEVFFHRRACGDPWTLEDFKVGERVVFNMFRVRRQGSKKVLRGYDVKPMDPRKERVK